MDRNDIGYHSIKVNHNPVSINTSIPKQVNNVRAELQSVIWYESSPNEDLHFNV